MGKIIGIVGSRRRDGGIDYKRLLDVFNEVYEEGDTIVSGGCPKGGDRFAEIIADLRKIPIIIHLPKWNEYGRAAGPIRNTLIAQDSLGPTRIGGCNILLAVVAKDRTGGTEDTIKKVEALGKPVILVE
jgi:hypothetical protein